MHRMFVVLGLLAALMAAVFAAPGANLLVAGGGEYSTDIEQPPVIVVDGGGDRSEVPELPPVLVVDGGGDRSPNTEQAPVLMVDGGGDRSPNAPAEDHTTRA